MVLYGSDVSNPSSTTYLQRKGGSFYQCLMFILQLGHFFLDMGIFLLFHKLEKVAKSTLRTNRFIALGVSAVPN